MKKAIFLVLLLSVCVSPFAQSQQKRIDSVCFLVKKYFNEKNADGLYLLGGEAFHKQLPLETFRQVCKDNLFPLGVIKETVFENNTNGVSKYKAVFDSGNISLLLSLDANNKLETLLFQAYQEEKPKKDHVATDNVLVSVLDKEVDKAVQPYMELPQTCGLSVGVLKDGKIYFYDYGETKRNGKKLPASNTIFEIGSISKTFTSILLADAIETGKIKLDDPINKYLPDSIHALEFNGTPITIRTLANHTSGISPLPNNLVLNAETNPNPYKDYDDKKMFSFYKTFTPVRKPGEKYEYSNLAVATLGVILERINKKTYEQLIVEKICDPLQMNDTRQYIRRNDSARFAKGYNESGADNSQWDFKAFAGAGSIRSTVADLLKYAKANLDEAPASLNKDIQLTHEVTFTDGKNKLGLGWHYIKPGTDEVIFHNGGTGGYRTYLAVNLQKKFAVVILSNTSIGTEKVGNELMKWLETN